MLPVPIRPGGTPVPIPNTTVKPRAADGTELETVWESRRAPEFKKEDGDVAQLGEHLPCKQGVESSNLFISIWGRNSPDGLIAQQVRARA